MKECRTCKRNIADTSLSCVHCGEEYPFIIICIHCKQGPYDGVYKGNDEDWQINKNYICKDCQETIQKAHEEFLKEHRENQPVSIFKRIGNSIDNLFWITILFIVLTFIRLSLGPS